MECVAEVHKKARKTGQSKNCCSSFLALFWEACALIVGLWLSNNFFFFLKSSRNLPLETVNLLVQIYVLLGPYIFLIISVLLWHFHLYTSPWELNISGKRTPECLNQQGWVADSWVGASPRKSSFLKLHLGCQHLYFLDSTRFSKSKVLMGNSSSMQRGIETMYIWSESECCSVVSNSLRPHGLYSPWNSPGQNTGVGGHFLLQWIFQTQGLNPGLLHCRQILYLLSHDRSPCTYGSIHFLPRSTPVWPASRWRGGT